MCDYLGNDASVVLVPGPWLCACTWCRHSETLPFQCYSASGVGPHHYSIVVVTVFSGTERRTCLGERLLENMAEPSQVCVVELLPERFYDFCDGPDTCGHEVRLLSSSSLLPVDTDALAQQVAQAKASQHQPREATPMPLPLAVSVVEWAVRWDHVLLLLTVLVGRQHCVLLSGLLLSLPTLCVPTQAGIPENWIPRSRS